MTSTSTAVIDGEVVDTRRGRLVGGPEDGIRFEEVEIAVWDVLSGELAEDAVVLEVPRWDAEGTPLEWVHGEHMALGDRGIFFLWRKSDPTPEPRYRLVSSQGQRVRDARNRVRTPTVHHGDELVERIRNMDDASLRDAVRRTVRGAPQPMRFAR